MQRTYLVALEQDTLASTDGMAESIREALEEDGLPVVSVKPWSAPSPDDSPSFGPTASPQERIF